MGSSADETRSGVYHIGLAVSSAISLTISLAISLAIGSAISSAIGVAFGAAARRAAVACRVALCSDRGMCRGVRRSAKGQRQREGVQAVAWEKDVQGA